MINTSENLERISERIFAACERAGRKRESVELIAVSKTKPVSDIREAMRLGIRCFGENRVQELRQKTAEIPEKLHWHMIGVLQKNKVKYLPGMVEMIHSVDSLGLAQEIEKECKKHGISMDVLCEVNVGREESKGGVLPEELSGFLSEAVKLPHLRIRGLMTVAPIASEAEESRPIFRSLRELLESMNREIPALSMDQLSMGMSGDFEVAIEEGATLVRIGSAIFGDRHYS